MRLTIEAEPGELDALAASLGTPALEAILTHAESCTDEENRSWSVQMAMAIELINQFFANSDVDRATEVWGRIVQGGSIKRRTVTFDVPADLWPLLDTAVAA